MAFEPTVYRRAAARHRAAIERRAAALSARTAGAYAAVPELAELDRALRHTVAQTVTAALTSGENTAAVVAEQRARNRQLQHRRGELLRGAGIDPTDLEDVPACLICKDTGRVRGGMCDCLRTLCTEEQIKELSRLLDLGGQSFETFSLEWYGRERDKMELVLDVCKTYAARFGTWQVNNLYLYGPPGLGKTFLSACIAREVSTRGFSVVYDTAVSIFAQFEAQKFDRDEDARDETRRYLNCDLLILDDLGSEMATPFVQSALYTLLNKRITAGRHTVISSNLSLESLDGRYQPQIVSRLKGEFRGLPFAGRDIRLQRKEQGGT